jgi:hypothetical protein
MQPAMSADSTDQPDRRPSIEDLARHQGVHPIGTAADLVCEGVFSSDEELDAFLADLRALRHSDAG